jgi:hypothetical protein
VAKGVQQVERVTSQKSPGSQLVASEQAVRQAPDAHRNGEQSVVPGAGQFPRPSQTLALLWVWLSLQLCWVEPQLTPRAAKRQAPLRGSQSVAPQGAVVLVQAEWQQWPLPAMPQTPEVQASFAEQAPVAIFGAHAPPLQ